MQGGDCGPRPHLLAQRANSSPQGNAGRRIASVDNKAIAETLGISATTVRNHIEHLLAKLGVHSKLEAVVYAAKSGLL